MTPHNIPRSSSASWVLASATEERPRVAVAPTAAIAAPVLTAWRRVRFFMMIAPSVARRGARRMALWYVSGSHRPASWKGGLVIRLGKVCEHPAGPPSRCAREHAGWLRGIL